MPSSAVVMASTKIWTIYERFPSTSEDSLKTTFCSFSHISKHFWTKWKTNLFSSANFVLISEKWLWPLEYPFQTHQSCPPTFNPIIPKLQSCPPIFNPILPSILSTHIQSYPSPFNPVHLCSKPILFISSLPTHIQSYTLLFNLLISVHSYPILSSPLQFLQSCPHVFNHILFSSKSWVLSTDIDWYPPLFNLSFLSTHN